MADNLWVQESYVDRTGHCRFGESDVYETFTDNKGELFRSLQEEYGRCVSKVYIDRKGKVIPVGWVFEKRMRYEDARGNDPSCYYLREVWVTLHAAPPTRHAPTYHYQTLNNGVVSA